MHAIEHNGDEKIENGQQYADSAVKVICIWVPCMLPEKICGEKRDLKAKNIQNNKIRSQTVMNWS